MILLGSTTPRALAKPLHLIDNLFRFLIIFLILGVIQGKLSFGLLNLCGMCLSIPLLIEALSFSQSSFVVKFFLFFLFLHSFLSLFTAADYSNMSNMKALGTLDTVHK